MRTMPPRRKRPATYTPDQIRAIRDKLGLTQEEAADKVEVAQGVWSSWESGDRKPSRQSTLLIRLLSQGKI